MFSFAWKFGAFYVPYYCLQLAQKSILDQLEAVEKLNKLRHLTRL